MFINKEIFIEIVKILIIIPKVFSEFILYHNDFEYSKYQYIVKNRRNIQDHYREFHNWTNPKFKNNKTKPDDDIFWTINIPCQQFFHSNPGKEYFKITLFSPNTLRRRQNVRSSEGGNDVESEFENENSFDISNESSTISQGIYKLINR